jgi:hypothetical protein
MHAPLDGAFSATSQIICVVVLQALMLCMLPLLLTHTLPPCLMLPCPHTLLQHQYPKPMYALPTTISKTGDATGYYQPKGAWAHGEAKRDWLKYEPWQPPQAK